MNHPEICRLFGHKITLPRGGRSNKGAGFADVSHGTIYNEVRDFGEKEAEEISDRRANLFERAEEPAGQKKKVPILFLEADGLMVKSQEDGERNMELKMGLMHEGWQWKSPSKKQRTLVNPRVVMGVYNDAEEFWEVFYTEVAKRYDLEDTVIVVNGDGAQWIQKRAREFLVQ